MSPRRLALASAALGLAAVLACLDDAPLAPTRPTVELALRARIGGGVAESSVQVRVFYRRINGELVGLALEGPEQIPLGPGTSTQLQVGVKISPCLDDNERPIVEGEQGCRLIIEVSLLDGRGEVVDSDQRETGPLLAGESWESPDPIVLSPPVSLTVTGGGAGTGSGIVTAPATEGRPAFFCTITEGTAGPGCLEDYRLGSEVTLTPTDGTLITWSGDCTGTGPCQLTMSEPRTVTATFALGEFILTVTGGGAETGSGRITSAPAGIDCTISSGAAIPSGCSASFSSGTPVVLDVVNGTLASWEGDCTGASSCEVIMDQPRSVTANLAPPLPGTLNVTGGGSGAGSGRIISSPAGIDCTISNGAAASTGCAASYQNGTVVTVSVASGTLTAWGGDCSGAGICRVTMDQARTVMATFEPEVVVPARVEITVSAVSLKPGEEAAATATVTDAEGNELGNAQVSWQSSDGTVASPDPTIGHTTAIGGRYPGTTQITAQAGAVVSNAVVLEVVPVFGDLGTLGGRESVAEDVNDNGVIVGYSQIESGETHAFIRTPEGGMQDLGLLAGSTDCLAHAINNFGLVVGECRTASGTRAVLWMARDEAMDLGSLGGSVSVAQDINDRSEVVGNSRTASGTAHAFRTVELVMQDLGTLGGATSQAHAINNNGTVVGESETNSGPIHAFVWTRSEGMQDIETHAGKPESAAWDISDGEVVVGCSAGRVTTSSTTCDDALAFAWTREGGFSDLGTLGGCCSGSYAISTFGEVVGFSRTAANVDHATEFHACNGADVLDVAPIDLLAIQASIGVGISRRGTRAVGYVVYPGGFRRAVLLGIAICL